MKERVISWKELIKRMQKVGVEIVQPDNVPQEILAKWRAWVAELYGIIFTKEVGYIAGWERDMNEKVRIPHSKTMKEFLKETKKFMDELVDLPAVKLSMGKALSKLKELYFYAGEDSVTRAHGLPDLIGETLPAADALPILFKMWQSEAPKRHNSMADRIAEKISTLILTLSKESKAYHQFLKQFVDLHVFENTSWQVKLKSGSDCNQWLEILPYVAAFTRAHYSDNCINNLQEAALFLIGFAGALADVGNQQGCQNTLKILGKLLKDQKHLEMCVSYSLKDLGDHLNKAGFNNLFTIKSAQSAGC